MKLTFCCFSFGCLVQGLTMAPDNISNRRAFHHRGGEISSAPNDDIVSQPGMRKTFAAPFCRTLGGALAPEIRGGALFLHVTCYLQYLKATHFESREWRTFPNQIPRYTFPKAMRHTCAASHGRNQGGTLSPQFDGPHLSWRRL